MTKENKKDKAVKPTKEVKEETFTERKTREYEERLKSQKK